MGNIVRLTVAGVVSAGALVSVGVAQPAMPAEDTCAVSVQLRVVDEKGAESPFRELAMLAVLGPDGKAVAFAPADADGVARLALPVGSYRIKKDPYPATPYWAEQDLEIKPGVESLDVKLRLQKTSVVSLEVQVLSERDGKPVPNIQLYWRRDGELHGGLRSVTNIEGKGAIENLWGHHGGTLQLVGKAIEEATLRVTPADLVRGTLTVKVKYLPPTPVTRVRLVIVEAGEQLPLRQALAKAGSPEDSWVRLQAIRGDTNPTGVPVGWIKEDAAVDQDGVAAFERIPPGEYVLHALTIEPRHDRHAARDYYPVGGALTFTVPAEGAAVTELETVFSTRREDLRVRGKVSAGPEAAAVAGASVTARDVLGRDEQKAQTAEDGSFEMDVYPSFRSFTVEADGFGTRVVGLYALPDRPVEIQLSVVHSAEGVVVDASDKPVRYAFVEAYGARPMKAEAVSDKQGRFKIKGLPPGTYVVAANGEGLFSRAQHVDVSSNVTDLRIQLEPAVHVVGRVEFAEAVAGNPFRILVFAYPDTRLAISGARIEEDGTYAADVPAAPLTVYLWLVPGPGESDREAAWYLLGAISPEEDEDGVNFRASKEVLANPVEDDEVPLR